MARIKLRHATLISLLTAILAIGGCQSDPPTQSETGGDGGVFDFDLGLFNGAPRIYVQAGANGDGSLGNPFGSLDSALVHADGLATEVAILVAAGTVEFSGVVRPTASVIGIFGSRDPSMFWIEQAGPVTSNVIGGEASRPVSLYVPQGSKPIYLYRLSFASAMAVTPDAVSAAVVIDSGVLVTVRFCEFASADGVNGLNGASGRNGVSGDSLWRLDDTDPRKHLGYGGRKGLGGMCGENIYGVPPERGFAPDGTQTGGMPAEDGSDGSNGAHGYQPDDLKILYSINDEGRISAEPNDTSGPGGIGVGGSGGGGGGGRWAFYENSGCQNGPDGGRGGDGGSPGEGGLPGKMGGTAIGIWNRGGVIRLHESVVHVGHGGSGGDGGLGGLGGVGDDGWPGEFFYYLMAGTDGGDGGRGGDGGTGGAGAGGSSIGVIENGGTTVLSDSQIRLGSVGLGGAGGAEPAANGRAIDRVSIVGDSVSIEIK